MKKHCHLRIGGLLGIAVFAIVSGASPQEWHSIPGGRWASLAVTPEGKAGFTRLEPASTGVAFTNDIDEVSAAANRVLLDGSGVAVGDFDRDGRPDVFLCSLSGRNTLYHNLGSWRFEDVTEAVGLRRDGRHYRGAVFADVNGDAAVDLLISVLGGGVECFLNDGKGRFIDGTAQARTASDLGSMTLALADVDGNGSLDLYVANNRAADIRDRGQVNLRMVNGQMVVPPEWRNRLTVMGGQVLEYGEPDQLYLNDGKGRFTPVSWTGGRFRDEDGAPLAGPPLDWGLTASFRDINGDGYPDLYVCNDFWTPDRVWLNDGKGRFRAIGRLAFRNMSASSMGVDFADIDRDGQVDCFVVDMLSRDSRLRKRQKLAQAPMTSPLGAIEDRPQFMRNTLYHNRGDGTFAEVANFAGVAASEWSWSPVFLDVDLDGYEDLLITSGHARDVQDLDSQEQIRSRQHAWTGFASEVERQKAFTRELMEHMRLYPRLETPIVAFRNLGNLRFVEMTSAWGTDQPAVHHSMATGDFDGDGDLDLVVNNLGSAAGIYRNISSAARVAVRLKGAAPNFDGIGARVTLLGATVPRQSQEVVSGGRYLGGSDPMLVFAPGQVERGMVLEVRWRRGSVSQWSNVQANAIYELAEGAGAIPTAPPAPSPSPSAQHFMDASNVLNHRHVESDANEFARQSLLPFKRTLQGPGIAWFDLDGDGAEELFVGAGRGSSMGAFRPAADGRLEPIAGVDGVRFPGGTSALVGWVSASGRRGLLVGAAGDEPGNGAGLYLWRLERGRLTATNLAALAAGGVGAIAVGDFDADGDLDVFIGGSIRLGRYPETGESRIYRADGDGLVLDPRSSKAVAGAGLVNGAVWTDLTGDGWPELVLAGEWGPIRIFANHRGELVDETQRWGLAALTGWWHGVTTGDVDGDGQLDLVAANWGLNSPYRAADGQPVRLFYGDFGGRGALDLVETEVDPRTRELTPSRTLEDLAGAMPFLREQFPTHRSYSEAGLSAVLKAAASPPRQLEAVTLATTVFLRRESGFVARILPTEAQLSPAWAVSVADLDLDGREDIFLSQNFFATRPDMPRMDAGRGLWLWGKGGGEFSAVAASESGLDIPGDQRGAALGDFDRDGRLDLAVGQNGSTTRLFKNVQSTRGLRVRLLGPVGNPDGVGAQMQLRGSGGASPVREVHGGSGYYSCDGAVQILGPGGPGAAMELMVRWPGGRVSVEKLPPGSATGEVSVRFPSGR